MAYQIDARGLPCPQPVLKTKEALEQAKGSSLVVIIDNEASRDNVIRFLENSGVTVEKVETRGNDFFVHTKETTGSVSSRD